MNVFFKILNIFLICFCLNVNFAFAQVYTWKDNQGVTHYSDQVNAQYKAKLKKVDVISPNQKDEKTQKITNVLTSETDPTEGWEKDKDGNKIPPNQSVACEVAQKNLIALSNKNYTVVQTNDKGEKTEITEEKKNKAIKQAQDDISFFCKP